MTKYILVLLVILGGCGTVMDTGSDAPKSRAASKEKIERRRDRSDSGGSGSCCG